ncbi:Pkinase-domain-containing protein [Tothia fuscella]|uniref:non-specific serine/threonine protein kinase n=1 Tax=Tothia fuscella TaxID=1048955 RepID=A0A9P4NP32_9PEZI|nr:Pkinase-domain-containing protein [Tothia fuscella]
MYAGTTNEENTKELRQTSRTPQNDIRITKNYSTSNLLSQARESRGLAVGTNKARYSLDGNTVLDFGNMQASSPVIPEHAGEHGLGLSGLRRIRQTPAHTRRPSPNGTGINTAPGTRSSSMNLGMPAGHGPPSPTPSGPTSPAPGVNNQFEDLHRFPSESLHSFSFAHQSEDSIDRRQNVLKRSIDFMRDKLGWAASNPGLVAAQARLSGDKDVQSMMELLARAHVIGQDSDQAHGLGGGGPMTGPADMSGQNVFEQSFELPRAESPTSLEDAESRKPLPRSSGSRSNSVAGGSSNTEDSLDPRTSMALDDSPRLTTSRPRLTLKRTLTSTDDYSLQSKLTDALAQPYTVHEEQESFLSHQNRPIAASPSSAAPQNHHPNLAHGQHGPSSAPHGHGNRWTPAAQAIFTTEASAPWTITAANDLACLVFGVTKAEVRRLGILEVVRPERRKWLEEKLKDPETGSLKGKGTAVYSQSQRASPNSSISLNVGSGITARLLSKPPSRQAALLASKRRSQTDDGSGGYNQRSKVKGGLNHAAHKSRGVLLCGDVVPIQKRNGASGSASLWVKEKKAGLIWVLEEIAEDIAYISVDEIGCITKAQGAIEPIWGTERFSRGMDVKRLIPDIPKLTGTHTGALNYELISETRTYTARTVGNINIPVTIDQLSGETTFRVSSFPHIAGIMVLNSKTLKISSSNSVFSSALFGQAYPDGLHINDILPGFDKVLHLMTDEDKIRLVDGIVIPEHSFRRARALLAMREGKADAASLFLRPSGLPARHRDGSEIMVDVQMRVVNSEKSNARSDNEVIVEVGEEEGINGSRTPNTEVVYALWITYSRHLHAANYGGGPVTPLISRPGTPPHQPSPGQSISLPPPEEAQSDGKNPKPVSLLTQQLKNENKIPLVSSSDVPTSGTTSPEPDLSAPPVKKTIHDFIVLEDMGQGAYGQVKLCRYKKNSNKKMVIKYVTKRRILVDTWTRDRRLGTVPLEIHVLDYLRRDDLKHCNIVEMADFFEDDINYYIEMIPHGLPGMDLFDYIELRVSMEENECRRIFVQVAQAIWHLHTKAKVVHRDIKDENVILDGEGNIKLIDFGSAAYIKNGPFDVFVGTIDYAAPEVLAGQSYRGKEQDVWALGILLYTIIYKENPFYSIDEIMDHDLRVPYIMSEASIELIRAMLNRDVDQRFSISEVLEHRWCKGEGEAL